MVQITKSVTCCVALLGALSLLGHTVLGQDAPVRIRVTSDLVMVDAHVRDKEGEPVRDLTASDFEVYQDGKLQKITHFSFLGEPASVVLGQASGALASRQDAASSRVGQGPVGIKLVIVIDRMSVDAHALVRVREALQKFFAENFRMGDRAMLVVVDNTFQIVQPFTDRSEVLLSALERLQPSGQPLDELDHLAVEQEVEEILIRKVTDIGGSAALEEAIKVAGQEILTYARNVEGRARIGLGALTALCNFLKPTAGRKSILYLSFGFPVRPAQPVKKVIESTIHGLGITLESSIRETVSRELSKIQDPNLFGYLEEMISTANRAGVSLYTIDARGLVAIVPSGTATHRGSVAAMLTGESVFSQIKTLSDSQEYLTSLAYGTGGLPFYNSNDLLNGVDRAYKDLSSYYLLGYVPSVKRKEGTFHEIEVRVRRRDVTTRYRRGYLETPEKQRTERELVTALAFPELYRELPVEISAHFFRGDKGQARVFVDLAIPASVVPFHKEQDKFKNQLAILGLAKTPDGKTVGEKMQIAKTVSLSLDEGQYRELRGQPLRSSSEFQLPPGTYRIPLVVREANEELIGATEASLEVPTLNPDRLTLSSVVLSNESMESQDPSHPLSFRGLRIFPLPGKRFQGDQQLFVYFHAYNATADPQSGKPSLHLQLSLIHPQGQMTHYPIHEMSAYTDAAAREIRQGASIPLNGLVPGRYKLRIGLKDRIKGFQVEQEEEFEILSPSP
ncbi:MAG: VWA domain-containing protein [Acidobacteria bacterium]|nr:VWA domain-containing protein [Acidobacteriota bacterium]